MKFCFISLFLLNVNAFALNEVMVYSIDESTPTWKDSKKADWIVRDDTSAPCSSVHPCGDDGINPKKADWQDNLYWSNPEKQIKRPEQKPVFDYPKACEGSCSEDGK